MSKRKYSFTITSFADLAKAYPHAVTEKVIPEKREQKADYAYIAKLLDCQIAVPGIEVSTGETVTPVHQETPDGLTQPEPSKTEVPAFLGKKHHGSENGA